MGRFDEDIRHELKMIARGQSMIKKAQERLALIAEAIAVDPGTSAAASPPAPLLSPEKDEQLRDRIRRIVRAPDYVSKYR